MARMIGLDLGSMYTRICTPDGGVILRCPSAAAIDRESHKLVAVGVEARDMLGRTPQDILAYQPIRGGVVQEFTVAARMLHAMFLNKQICSTFSRPTVLMATPYRISDVHQLAGENAAFEAGARAVAQIPGVYAAALGAGLRVTSPRGCMVLNMGGGITEAAVISSGGIIAAQSLKPWGEKLDDAIIGYLKEKRNLIVGARIAERLRVRIGSADASLNRGSMTVPGLNARTGLASQQEVFSHEITDAITPQLRYLMQGILSTLENVPPEIASDVWDFGIMLTGGCAETPGLRHAITRATGLRVTVARNPHDCTVLGLSRLIEHPELWGERLDFRLK